MLHLQDILIVTWKKVRKVKKSAEMTTNECVYGKVIETHFVQRNSENLEKKKKKGNKKIEC